MEIRAEEGETVEVDSIVAILGAEGETVASSNGDSGAKTETDSSDDNQGIDEISEHPMKPDEAKVTETAVKVTAEATSADVSSDDSSENSETAATSASGEATEVVMPQMGESITEGTISKWLKAIGDTIERDEPLLEISTDKVDAEVPSPVAGTLLEIRAEEGETVEVDSVVGVVGAKGSSVGSQKPAQTETKTEAPKAVDQKPENDVPPADEGKSYDYQHPGAVADAQKSSSKRTR